MKTAPKSMSGSRYSSETARDVGITTNIFFRPSRVVRETEEPLVGRPVNGLYWWYLHASTFLDSDPAKATSAAVISNDARLAGHFCKAQLASGSRLET